MDVKQMRKEVLKFYSGQKWKDRVNKMNDDQVMAIYYSFIERQKKKK